MRYLNLIARTILPYRLLWWWYRLTIGKDFAGTYCRIPLVRSKWLKAEEGNDD